MLFALLTLTLLVCYCLSQRRRRKHKRRASDSVPENNKDLDRLVDTTETVELKKSWKKYEPEKNRKLTNKELQEQRQNIILDVSRLPSCKGAYTKNLASPTVPAEKLIVAMEERKLLDGNTAAEETQSFVHDQEMSVHQLSRSTSTTSSLRHHRPDQMELVSSRRPSDKIVASHRCGGHPGPPQTSGGSYSRHTHGYSGYRMQAGVHEFSEDLEEPIDSTYSVSHHDNSRIVPCGHVDTSRCDPSYSVYSKSMQEDFSESEEVAMLMASRSATPRCGHEQYRRCGCHRASSQQRYDDARRMRRPQRRSSSFQESDVYHSEADARERLLTSPNRQLSRTSVEDSVLPPYESVVFSDSSHSTTPSCDCGHHFPPATSGLYLQSPPPSYSHHCSRTSQSRRSNNEPRSGCERSCSGSQTSRHEHTPIRCAGHNDASASNGDNVPRDHTSVLSHDDNPNEFSNGTKSPTRNAVA